MDNRIRVFNKENEGVSSARNLAMDIAKGDYILFVEGSIRDTTPVYIDTYNDWFLQYGQILLSM